MKKILSFLLLNLVFVSAVFSQTFTGKADQKLQAGFNFYGNGTGIKASYDYGLNDNFSIGAGGVFFSSGSYQSKIFLFGRGDYHFAQKLSLPEELDLYLGLELGLLGNTDFGLGAHLGARYPIRNNLYLFAEVGNNGALGVSLHL